MNYDVKIVNNHKSSLGEGPIWDFKYKRLLWVDINEKYLYVNYVDSDNEKRYSLIGMPGTVVPETEDTVILAIDISFYRFNLITKEYTLLNTLKEDKDKIRFNDGKCDAKGRFYCGTMSKIGKKGQGALFVLKNDLTIEKKIDNVSTSNGIVWNKDNTKMFYIDSKDYCVYEYDYDLENGEISNKKICIDGREKNYKFDGMAIDIEDNLWIAHYGGAKVTCHNPYNKELIHQIDFKAKNTTACAIGGKEMKTLFVTSAKQEMTKEDLETYPDSGALFSVEINKKGAKANYFKCE